MEHSREARRRTGTADWTAPPPSQPPTSTLLGASWTFTRWEMLCFQVALRPLVVPYLESKKQLCGCVRVSSYTCLFFPTHPSCNCTVRFSGPPRSWRRCWIHSSGCKFFCPIAKWNCLTLFIMPANFHFLASRTNWWTNCVLRKRGDPPSLACILWPRRHLGIFIFGCACRLKRPTLKWLVVKSSPLKQPAMPTQPWS